MASRPLDDLIDDLRPHWTSPDAERHFVAARTRRAFLDERAAKGLPTGDALGHHEPYEWLGDRVLGLLVADRLWRAFPHAEPGRLTKALADLVSEGPLFEIGREIGLDHPEAVRMGDGERDQRQVESPKAIASHLEALIGAAWLAGGAACAGALVERLFADRWPAALPTEAADPERDPMSRLNELVQRTWRESLSKDDWFVVSDGGSPPRWRAALTLPDESGPYEANGWYPTMKAARAATAEVVLRTWPD